MNSSLTPHINIQISIKKKKKERKNYHGRRKYSISIGTPCILCFYSLKGLTTTFVKKKIAGEIQRLV